MSSWIKILAVSLSVIFLTNGNVSADEFNQLQVIESPESHVWDVDNLFRNNPEKLRDLSKILTDLEEESGLEFYIVTYSSVVGEKPKSVADRCQKEWLGEENDGLVMVLGSNKGTSGVLGRSIKLYDGHFIEKGMMPRISHSNLIKIIQGAIIKIKDGEEQVDQVDRVHAFASYVSRELKKRIEITKQETASKENYHFMGWMALALFICGILLALLLKLVRSVDGRSRELYQFPEFTVPQRLRAANGGGKISVVDFGSPPSFDV